MVNHRQGTFQKPKQMFIVLDSADLSRRRYILELHVQKTRTVRETGSYILPRIQDIYVVGSKHVLSDNRTS